MGGRPRPRVPDFSTLHYRVRRLPQERWEEFNRWLAQRALAWDEPELLLVDGTGWGFGLPYWACWRRVEELRRLPSHVKGVVVVGELLGKRVLLGPSLGPPYSDERRLAERWLQSQGSKGWGEGLWLVAHALYAWAGRCSPRCAAWAGGRWWRWGKGCGEG